MNEKFENRCKSLVETLGLTDADQVTDVRRLTGGVASDIAAVTFGDKTVCVKFALSKLRVQEDWFAPVHRNKAEYAWLEFAQKISPSTTPKLFGWSEQHDGFAMEFISGETTYLWKDALLKETSNGTEAVEVASLIGKIHSASSKSDFDSKSFQNRADFESIRIEPYLRFTATRHSDISDQILGFADQLSISETALVHGDVSPKNILLRNGQPILLDAECATMGDPCFDVAFCLNHLFLKSVHLPASTDALLSEILDFWRTYRELVDWEDSSNLEQRVSQLLPMLMLARVDGKSPVEYLSEASKTRIRQMTKPIIQTPVSTISQLVSIVKHGAVS